MAESQNQNVALFIDWDNLAISTAADMGGATPDVKRIVQKSQEYGRILIARAYAEWNTMSERLSVYRAGVEPVYAPTFRFENDPFTQAPRGKSLADPVMVTDCIDILHIMPQITTFVLVTGDKDLIPVVRLAQLRGRRVVVIGPDLVAAVLRDMADEFVSYRALVQMNGAVEAALPAAGYRPREVASPATRRQPARPVLGVKPAPSVPPVRPPVDLPVRDVAPSSAAVAEPEAPDLQSIFASLVDILQNMTATGRARVRATNLKDQLLVRVPGFSERKYGFSKFKDLLLAAERSGLVTVSAVGPVHWVSLPSVEPLPVAATEAPSLVPSPEPVGVVAAVTATVDEAEQAARARERRLAVVRFVDSLRARSRWLTYTYVLTNVIGFIGRVVPPGEAEQEARSILNYLVAEGALRIDKVPQEVDVGGIKHRVRMCHFVDDHPLVREARSMAIDDLPAELAAELAPAGEAVVEPIREPLERPQTPAGEPSLELREVGVTAEAVASTGAEGGEAHEAVETAAAEPVGDGPAPEAPPERSGRSRRRGGRRSRSAAAREAAEPPAEAFEPAGAPEATEAEQPPASAEAEGAPMAPDVALEPAPKLAVAVATSVETPSTPAVEEQAMVPPVPEAAAAEVVAPPTREQVFAEARRVLEDLERHGKARVTGSSLKLRLGKIFPGFDERKLGFGKFRDFLQAAEQEGYVSLEMEGQVSWVRPPRAEQVAEAPDGSVVDQVAEPVASAAEAPAREEAE